MNLFLNEGTRSQSRWGLGFFFNFNCVDTDGAHSRLGLFCTLYLGSVCLHWICRSGRDIQLVCPVSQPIANKTEDTLHIQFTFWIQSVFSDIALGYFYSNSKNLFGLTHKRLNHSQTNLTIQFRRKPGLDERKRQRGNFRRILLVQRENGRDTKKYARVA